MIIIFLPSAAPVSLPRLLFPYTKSSGGRVKHLLNGLPSSDYRESMFITLNMHEYLVAGNNIYRYTIYYIDS